jgi:HEAT repeat protein
MKCFFLFLFGFFFSFARDLSLTEQMKAFLILEDPDSVIQIAENIPEREVVQEELLLSAYSQKGEADKLLKGYHFLQAKYPEKKLNPSVLSHVCWGILNKAKSSDFISHRKMAIIGAFLSRESKGICFIEKMMDDLSPDVRAFACSIATQLRDYRLQKKLGKVLEGEKDLKVRLSCIHSLGQMQTSEAILQLKQIAFQKEVFPEEKELARFGLLHLLQEVDPKSINAYLNSKNPNEKAFACELVLNRSLSNKVLRLLLLLQDEDRLVRKSALLALGILLDEQWPEQVVFEHVKKRLHDLDPEIQLIAAWIYLQKDASISWPIFEYYLNHEKKALNYLASVLLSSGGKKATPFLEKAFECSQNDFIKVNLAFGLLHVGTNVQKALDFLQIQVLNESQMISLSSFLDQNFHGFVPLERLQVLAYGMEFKWVDSMTRLQIINAILCFDPKRATDLLPTFLKKSEWGILLLSSQLFNSLFPNDTLPFLEKCLEHEDIKVRVQAALILSYFTGSKKAFDVLVEGYRSADATRLMKMNILEGLMSIRSKNFLSFFVEVLDEKDSQLQLAAASCILCLLNY